MTKITIDRAVVEQALEAMLNFPDDISDDMFNSIAALKAALAEPEQEPVVFWGVDWGSNGDLSCAVISRRTSDGNREILAVEYGPTIAPPQRKPLTQTEVVEGFCKQPHDVQFVSVFNAGVRFAEAAHGIKGETK